MKHLIIILIFIGSKSTAQQNLAHDSLEKYSYFVNGYQKGAWSNGSGSGFFIRKKKAIFFVTNYHVYTGYDPITQEYQPCDTISIRLKTDKDSLFVKIPSHRDSSMERKIKNLDVGDLVVIKINKRQGKVFDSIGIFDITHLINNFYFTSQPSAIFFYGFPSHKVTYSKSSKMLVPIAEKSYSKFKEIDSSVYNRISRMNYTLTDISFQKNYRKQYFLISNTSFGGMSGSPIFGEYSINGKLEYRLIGVVRGGAKDLTECINPVELFRRIKK